ncbi:zinc finger C2H2 domain-containing protein [Candidatus Nitrososphaera gargensis Ga9.2]|uniref:Zinc finger C2H2 domain-containing protein n=1 Tax=Nitrososphaera gargensis (strain Ga9.2) TaxID=1237085 RepID=K0ID29_NITGG|nr:zinc finger C2H2 domain-containing protein [Candidatus Nitrososphaera gargensis Ga9.2]
MGASQAEPRHECRVCGRMFKTLEDLMMHNREAHVGGTTATTTGQAM